MTAVEKALFAIATAPTTNVSVVMGMVHQDATSLARIQMTEAVADEFRTVVANAPWWDPTDYEMREYDPAYKPDARDVVYAPISSVPGLSDLIKILGATATLPQFAADDEAIESLKFYAIVGGTAKARTFWLRSYSPKKILSRSAAFALMQRKGSFNVVKENIMTFDDRIDCIVHGSFVFVRDASAFVRIFDLMEQVKASAVESIGRLTTMVAIANAAEFQEVCSRSIQMAVKAVQIAKRSYSTTLTMDDIARTIKKHKLAIALDSAGHLIFDRSPKTRWLILRVLDDAYLDSTMTGLSYEANSKAVLGTAS